MGDSIIQQIQEDVAARLLADPYFVDIPVLTENLLDIQNQFEIAIAQIGIMALVMTPNANVKQMQDAPLYFGEIKVAVKVLENVSLNRGSGGVGKTALAVAEHALVIVHNYRPANVSESLYAANPTLALEADERGLLVYNTLFETHGGVHYDIETCADPVVTNDGGTVTITCATPHAQMWYVTGGDYPNPATGTFYDAPFAAMTGQRLKVRAWLWGFLPSKQVNLQM